MSDCKPVSTPVDVSHKLDDTGESTGVDKLQYQAAVGSLMYLSVWTRPDIAFAVGMVARYTANPKQQHWAAVKRIFRYLKGSQDRGIEYANSPVDDLHGYSDADWAGDVVDRKSTSGYVFILANGPISWRSKKQTCVALSTAEAEYVALAAATQEAVWLKALIAELRGKTSSITMYDDNQAAISMSKNPQFHGRAKHIDIKYHFVRDQVERKVIILKYCESSIMFADILTKGLPREGQDKLSRMMNLK
jgi:hypothetical protein